MVDPHRLRMLQAVVTQGSVHQAARLLGYTPSTVSQHLAALQRETGLSLLERRGRALSPTEAGRQLASAAGEVLGRLAEVNALARDLREGRRGSLRLSYIASAGVALIPPIVARLIDDFPNVRLDLRLNEGTVDPGFLPDLDIAVVQAGGVMPSEDGYASRALLQDDHVAVVPRGHRLYERDSVRPDDLTGERLVDNDVGRGPCRQAVLDLLSATGTTPTFGVEAHDYAAAIEFVAAGVGVSIIPRLGIRRLPSEARIVPIVDPTPYRTIVLRTREAVASHPVVVRATELLCAAASTP